MRCPHGTTLPAMRSLQARLPIMVGVNGPVASAHSAQHADIIGLMMLGWTLEDGHHQVRGVIERLHADAI